MWPVLARSAAGRPGRWYAAVIEQGIVSSADGGRTFPVQLGGTQGEQHAAKLCIGGAQGRWGDSASAVELRPCGCAVHRMLVSRPARRIRC